MDQFYVVIFPDKMFSGVSVVVAVVVNIRFSLLVFPSTFFAPQIK